MNRSFGVVTSILLHSLAGIALFVLAQTSIAATLPRTPSVSLIFTRVVPIPELPELSPKIPRAHLEMPRLDVKPPDVAEISRPEPRVEPTPAPLPRTIARLEPVRPLPVEPRHDSLPIEPARPQVAVGAFAASPAAVPRAPEVARVVEAGGFDTQVARAPQVSVPTAVVGAFDRSSAAAQPGTDRANRAVASAGFSGATSPGSPAPSTGSAPPREVRLTEFDARASQPAASPGIKAPAIDVPVEILSKPTPAYTDEARELKLEGEVVLEVEFTASGAVHVLRVVRGLGHGLDEAASRAASAMRFSPARSGGRPVDYRTTVHIMFRLA